MKNLNIAVFHYHFLPGGVTTVAALSLRAVMQHGRTRGIAVKKIAVICGRKENTDTLLSNEIIPYAENGTEVSTVIVPELDYLPQSGFDNIAITSAIASVFDKFRGWIWWVHNYQLGKNPLFTRILADYLAENNNQKALLHIHDFPECARISNYRFLTQYVKNIYPVCSNIRYITINSRDAGYLKLSGIPESMVYLLSDPVPDFKEHTADADKNKFKKMLSENFASHFPAFDSEKPYALYPVRTIRRKNILEAGLISVITGENNEIGFNLIVTLPGISFEEKKYSDIVRSCFEEGLIPGIWGCGSTIYGKPAAFNDVIGSADLIISSSVLEGFGYLFIDALRWGKPLAARYLDIIDGFSDVFAGTASLFYKKISVPASGKESELLKKRYIKSLENYRSFLNTASMTELQSKVEKLFENNFIDFSFLSASDQKAILIKTASDAGYRNEVRKINAGIIKEISETACSKQKYPHDKIDKYFSLKSFAYIFSEIIYSFDSYIVDNSIISCRENKADISVNLLKTFLKPENIRLILTDRDTG